MLIVEMIILIVAILLMAVGVSHLITLLLAPEGWLFYQMTPAAEIGMILLLAAVAIAALSLILRRLPVTRAQSLKVYTELWDRMGHFRPLLISVYIILLYCCLCSVTFVDVESIKVCSPLCPLGKSYAYEQVEQIEAGFGKSRFTFLEYKRRGQFYYKLRLDGKTVIFTVPSVNDQMERYAYDSYLELEDFDKALTALGVPKISSADGSEYCNLDTIYVDRFLRIIENR